MKENLKKNKLIVGIYEGIMGPVHKYYDKLKERFKKTRFSYGEKYPDRIFYVIKSDVDTCGIFSLIFTSVLPFLRVSERRGYVPIVDYKNTKYLPLIQDKDDFEKENPWEYYFEQPGGDAYSLEEVYQSKKVEMGYHLKHGFKVLDRDYMLLNMPERELKYWNRIVGQYIRPTDKIQDLINTEKSRMMQNSKILGVSIRAEYRWLALNNNKLVHNLHKVDTCEYYIEKIKEMLDKWGYNEFFLSCEDREYTTKISSYFGSKCHHMERKCMHYFLNDIPITNEEELYKEYKDSTVKEITRKYIAETYLLASCDSLYATISGNTVFAYIVNGGNYKHMEIYDTGQYNIQ